VIADVVQKNEENNTSVTVAVSSIEIRDEDVTLRVPKSRAKDELTLTGFQRRLSIPSTPDFVFLGSGNMDRSDVENSFGLVPAVH
jgi:hypothetical protein